MWWPFAKKAEPKEQGPSQWERGINAAAAHDLLAEMAELAAEERGAFLEEETL